MPGFLSGGMKSFAFRRCKAGAETEVVDARRAGPLATSIFCPLIPPFQFHQAIQRLRIIVIIGKAGDFILVRVLPRASSRLIVILEFVVIIVRVP
jgi:hypothetical protein